MYFYKIVDQPATTNAVAAMSSDGETFITDTNELVNFEEVSCYVMKEISEEEYDQLTDN